MKRLAVACAILLAGCAHIDTGQVDYRIADEPGPLTQRNLMLLGGNRCKDDIAEPCDPLRPSRVLRRYMPDPAKGWDALKNGQIFSIEVEQGMIGSNILEGEILGIKFGKTAEVAILANVFEFASQNSDADKKRFLETGEFSGKSGDPSDVELKLVYFGDDIRRGQSFNFSNIPLVPRSVYGGGSVGIQLVIMEVDAQAGPVASLLKTLAKFGQQALPGPGEAKDMLFDLGESLLTGSHDDKLLEYRFVLSAGTEDNRAVQATFAPGRYVIRRAQDRSNDMGWDSLRLDHNTGRLFKKSSGANLEEVRDDLYLVVNVRRYPAGTSVEFYTQKDWSEFRAALQAAADAKAAPLDIVTADISKLLIKERSGNILEGLRGKWAIARNRLEVYSSRYSADFSKIDRTQCLVPQVELERRLDIVQREASDAVRNFLADYQAALALKRKDASGASVDEFELTNREKLVSEVATYFMPWATSGADSTKFVNAGSFETAFVLTGAAGDIASTSLATAKSYAASPTTCESLMSR